jgi:chaperonin GroES
MSQENRIKPLGERILVKRLEEKEQIKGGIIIPDSAKEKPQEAEVVSLGTGKTLENGEKSKFEVVVGDTVLISKYGGTDIKLDGQEYLILREDDILAVLKK